MRIQNVIEAGAEVVTIARLTKGDTYKRVVAKYNDPTNAELRFGVVTGVMNNGTEGAFTALEYTMDYNVVKAENVTFRSGGQLELFAATPEELLAHSTQLLELATRAVATAERDLLAKRSVLTQVERLMADTSVLSAPALVGDGAGR